MFRRGEYFSTLPEGWEHKQQQFFFLFFFCLNLSVVSIKWSFQVECWIKYPKHSTEQAQTEHLETGKLREKACIFHVNGFVSVREWSTLKKKKIRLWFSSACSLLTVSPRGIHIFNYRMDCHSSLGGVDSIRGGAVSQIPYTLWRTRAPWEQRKLTEEARRLHRPELHAKHRQGVKQAQPCLCRFKTKDTAREWILQRQTCPPAKRLANNSCVYTRENWSHSRRGN